MLSAVPGDRQRPLTALHPSLCEAAFCITPMFLHRSSLVHPHPQHASSPRGNGLFAIRPVVRVVRLQFLVQALLFGIVTRLCANAAAILLLLLERVEVAAAFLAKEVLQVPILLDVEGLETDELVTGY